MKNDQQSNNDLREIMSPEFAGTDPNKVKQEIQKDVSAGEGSMTSREAGGMKD